MHKGPFFIVVGIILGFGLGFTIFHTTQTSKNVEYFFSNKTFYDNAQILKSMGVSEDMYGQVYIAGTLTGDGVGYKDNTVQITCDHARMICSTNEIDGISSGMCQLSRLDTPTEYPVTTWNDYEIIATDGDDVPGCVKTTITIERQSQSALWVEEPINQTTPSCKDSSDKIYKWTIEDPSWAQSN